MDINKNKYVADWMVGNKFYHSIIDFILILIGLAVVIVSIKGWLGDPVNEWFSRSGSVLVLIGAILEYKQTRFSQLALEESIRWASGVGEAVVFAHAWHRILVKYIAHTFVISGTMIWGYGDKWI